jgi:hydrogenase maturation protease
MAADPGTRAATSPGSGSGASAFVATSPGSGSGLGSGPAAGVLIVGYGNPLRSDDGVGPVVAERLASDPRFAGADVRAEHQLTPELALDASNSWLLVLVDAAEGVAAGEVAIRELGRGGSAGAEGGLAGRFEEGGPPLTHHVDPAALLGLAAELWGAAPRTILVGIGPASLDLGERLTMEVEAAVPRAIDAVADMMAALRDARAAGGAGDA